jgi:hypothetical protein
VRVSCSRGELHPDLADLGHLVGGVHHRLVAAGGADPLAQLALGLVLVRDRRVVADGGDELGDLRAEAHFEIAEVLVGVLEHVVQHGRGHDVIG